MNKERGGGLGEGTNSYSLHTMPVDCISSPPPSTPLPPHTHTPIPVAESEFGPNAMPAAERLTKTLILVGTVTIFQRHRMEQQPFADDCQLHQSSNPSATDQTLLSVQGCIYDTKDWLSTLANRRQDRSNAI